MYKLPVLFFPALNTFGKTKEIQKSNEDLFEVDFNQMKI